MKSLNQINNLIGSTPLIKISNTTKSNLNILAKLETSNLTGSIKDRMALFMLKKAMKLGQLQPRGTIIEATTGNTGISFSALARVIGSRMIAVMPENQSLERIRLLKTYGAELILTPSRYGPLGAIEKRDELALTINKSWVPNQFSNSDNIEAHEKGIGPEILKQFKGKIDYLVHGVGTGGTLMGVANALKRSWPDLQVVAVEPSESSVLAGKKPGNHNIQGIGEGFIPSIVRRSSIDKIIAVSTREAIRETRGLLAKTSIFVGFSSGANLAAIKKLETETTQPVNVVTIFADRGDRYYSLMKLD